MVKRFLDLTDYFHSATNPQINDILNQPLFVCDNPAAVIELSDDWMRKRFTSIQSLGILDKINVKTTAKKAHEYGITLILDKKNGKDAIVISEDRNEIKQILRFLNEAKVKTSNIPCNPIFRFEKKCLVFKPENDFAVGLKPLRSYASKIERFTGTT